jgi:hypothetical protein
MTRLEALNMQITIKIRELDALRTEREALRPTPPVDLHPYAELRAENEKLQTIYREICKTTHQFSRDKINLEAEIEQLKELVETAYRDGWQDGSVRDPFGNVGSLDDWERSDAKAALAGKEGKT